MKKMFLVGLTLLFCACHDVRKKTTDAAMKATSGVGEIVGKTGSEFVNGVKDGINNTFGCTLAIGNKLQAEGVSAGKFYITEDTVKHNYNIITVYLIFDKDFQGPVTAKVYDTKKNEYGRAAIMVTAKKNEAHYYEFYCDPRTNMEDKSSIVLE